MTPSTLCRIARIIFLAVYAAGCGTQASVKKSDAAVFQFHSRLNAEAFDQIYADSDDVFKTATPQQKFVALLSAVHRKLGSVKSANRTGFFVNFGTSGTTARVNYTTQFERDTASEEFIFRGSGDNLRLSGYHISSDALVTQ